MPPADSAPGGDSPDTGVIVHDPVFVPLPDGRRLAATLWLPGDADTRPAPAVLEYIPYRRRDGTAARDSTTHPLFAAAGIAGVRVDTAGHGDSDGVFDDEYSEQELADAEAVIAWLAAEPWCNGRVGMMGISWGGFNALQVAARRPPALRAVVSVGSTVDRYHDDIHYKGGCQLGANFSWSSFMLCYGARAPDPLVVGDGWRDTWLERLNTQPFPLAAWLAHPRRDGYWKHGSICEDYAAIEAAVYIASGWADGYRNAPPTAAARLAAPVTAVNGPWIHKYPHFAWPRPRIDFTGECIAWWRRWLQGEDDGREWPAYRAFISQAVRPGGRREDEDGFWVTLAEWPSPRASTRVLHGVSGRLDDSPGAAETRTISSPQDCGTACGEYFALKPEDDLPGDQQGDDAASLTFETAPLAEDMVVLGRPLVEFDVSLDRPYGNLAVRLVDVHADGVCHRVSLGVLNLAHRLGSEAPRGMEPGTTERVAVALDESGYRFLAGHRIRLSISTAYWPYLLPPPWPVTATLSGVVLSLPLLVDAHESTVAAPADPDPLPRFVCHRQPESARRVERDPNGGDTRYVVVDDSGDHEMPGHGLIVGERREDSYRIDPADPLEAMMESTFSHRMQRGDWRVAVEAWSRMTCDAENFHLEARVTASEGDAVVHVREWRESIPRDFL